MQRKLLTWFTIRYAKLRKHRALGFFSGWLDDAYLFHLNERSVPGGVAVGLFCAWIPMPFQMLIAVPIAVLLRVNVPLSVMLVWVSNPFTMAPMFYFAYVIGIWVSGEKIITDQFQSSMNWLIHQLHYIGEPLLLGCLIMGVACSVFGYLVTRLLWNKRLSRLLKLLIQRHQREQDN